MHLFFFFFFSFLTSSLGLVIFVTLLALAFITEGVVKLGLWLIPPRSYAALEIGMRSFPLFVYGTIHSDEKERLCILLMLNVQNPKIPNESQLKR